MSRILIFLLVLSGCVANGPAIECSSDLDCREGASCTNGSCVLAEPPVGASCQPGGTPRPDMPTQQAWGLIVGRWRTCEQHGVPLLLNRDAEGVEFLVTGKWRNLGFNPQRDLVPINGAEDRGEWKISAQGELELKIETGDSSVRYVFSEAPLQLELIAEGRGSMTLVPFVSAPLACERLPPGPSPAFELPCADPAREFPCYCSDHTSSVRCNEQRRIPACFCGDPELDRFRAGVLGNWSGVHRRDGEAPREVYLYIDGLTMTAVCRDCDCSPMGKQLDENKGYQVVAVEPDGSARIQPSWGDALIDRVILSPDASSLSFRFNLEGSPSSEFELQRATLEPLSEMPACRDQPASCDCQAPRCCFRDPEEAPMCFTCDEAACATPRGA